MPSDPTAPQRLPLDRSAPGRGTQVRHHGSVAAARSAHSHHAERDRGAGSGSASAMRGSLANATLDALERLARRELAAMVVEVPEAPAPDPILAYVGWDLGLQGGEVMPEAMPAPSRED